MKTFLLPMMLLLVNITLAQTAVNFSSASKSNATIKNNDFNSSWLTAAQQRLKKTEYHFIEKEKTATFFAANRAQHTGFSITPDGYTVYPVNLGMHTTTAESWQQHFRLLGIKKGNQLNSIKGNYNIVQQQSLLRYEYASCIIEYQNDESGMRQNFILPKKLEGEGSLQVQLELSGDMTASGDGSSLTFLNKKGTASLFYTDLRVWDATHKPLKASMQMNNNTLSIVVDDADAVYPVTIDPINKTPEWITSADGIIPGLALNLSVDAAYGFSVAGVGDVNGDGFDDVAIGAPALADVITGTGTVAAVGAVFVYYGSPTGLPTIPSVKLQPTTAIAGALFGYSIAGGDINHDNKSDIIVGAPLDAISIDIGGGSTASGTVGKVYVYNGTTLTTGSSPLLSLQLSGNSIIQNGLNLSVNALFGFSVAVTEDMNADNNRDIIVGAPTYAGIRTDIFGDHLDVQSGGAFLFTSTGVNTYTINKLEPIKTSILGLPILQSNINGLLFGYSVDGLGDYNGDGYMDLVVGAPAGVDLSSVNVLLNNKLFQGSAVVYYGNGAGVNINPGATLSATSGGLLTNITGTISNIANLFGSTVKGARNTISGARNGNVLVGAPLGGDIMNVLSLQLKTGTVSVFKKQSSSPITTVAPSQTLSSPRNNNTILGLIQSNLLFGYSLDNAYDINCDGFGDLIVGEPASSGLQLLNTSIAGGAAYIYLGQADGTYQTTPYWTLTANEDALLGINATSLIGYSVAGTGHTKGSASSNKILVGTPSRTLDFGAGLLNLGGTLGTIFSLVGGDNGVGKSYLFDMQACGLLAVSGVQLSGTNDNGQPRLNWVTQQEINTNRFEIERSSDGTNFTFIGKTGAAGNSANQLHYGYNDPTANAGVNYYRLKIVDTDGSFTYSNVVAVNIVIKGVFVRAVYPSPFIDAVHVTIASESNGTASCTLFDNMGRAVNSMQVILKKGINIINISSLGKLAPGNYFLQIKADGVAQTQKLVKS